MSLLMGAYGLEGALTSDDDLHFDRMSLGESLANPHFFELPSSSTTKGY